MWIQKECWLEVRDALQRRTQALSAVLLIQRMKGISWGSDLLTLFAFLGRFLNGGFIELGEKMGEKEAPSEIWDFFSKSNFFLSPQSEKGDFPQKQALILEIQARPHSPDAIVHSKVLYFPPFPSRLGHSINLFSSFFLRVQLIRKTF